MSKLISKSKSQSTLSSASSSQQAQQQYGTSFDGDNVSNDDVKICDQNTDASGVQGNALPGFLKGGLRRSFTQVSLSLFWMIFYSELNLIFFFL